MVKKLNELAKEELLEYIEVLRKQLNNEKYGLYFDRKATPETIIELSKENISVLNRDNNKDLLFNGYENILIEGDNYQLLSNLMMINGEGIIDVIYIDPPYNTGNGDFIYEDKIIDTEDGFKHTKWLNFIEKRLLLANNILKDDGVIFISIDDNEQANLKLLMDSIFGSKNFLACTIINSAPAGTQSSVDFATQHSYCLVYRKSESYTVSFQKLTEEELDYKYPNSDSKGKYYVERLWKRGIGGRMEDVPTLHFYVYFNQDTKEIFIDDEINNLELKQKEKLIEIIPYQTKGVLGRWTWSKKKMINEREKLIVVKVAGEWKLHKKVYSTEDKGKRPYSIIGSKIGRTELGSIELKNILGYKAFDYPKYSSFIKYLINLHDNKNAVVLDFFAGSGTTGQAVLELNKEDGGNRRFILCTNNENNIMTDVCYPRIKTVVTGIRPDGSKYSDGIPANVRYFKTAFIEDSPSKDQAKYNLVEQVDSLLCIAENVFDKLESGESFTVYGNSNDNKAIAIFNDYYDKNDFENMLQAVTKQRLNQNIVYYFSLDNTIDESIEKKVLETIPNAIVKPIPSKIYEIYKKIADDLRRDY